MTELPCLPDAPGDVRDTLDAAGAQKGLRGYGGIEGYCTACYLHCEAGKPDPCLGWLPGCSQACCGHGDPARASVTLGGSAEMPGVTQPWRIVLEGEDALSLFAMLRAARERCAHGEMQWHLDEAREAELVVQAAAD